MDDIYEWEFPEPSHLVDVERVCREVNDIPAIFAKMYMRKLFENAPIVYGRLKARAIENGRMKWHEWYEDNKPVDRTASI